MDIHIIIPPELWLGLKVLAGIVVTILSLLGCIVVYALIFDKD